MGISIGLRHKNGGKEDISIWNSLAKQYYRFQKNIRRQSNPQRDLSGYPDPRSIIHDSTYLKMLQNIDYVKHKHLLDVGCADGLFTKRIAREVGQVTAIDGASNFIDIANTHYPRRNITFQTCNILQKLPFKNETFDIVSSSLTLMDVKKLDLIAKNLCAVLKPGGDMIFSITHPCFYSKGFASWRTKDGYVQYVHISECYDCESKIKKRVGGDVVNVSHYHRPINMYVNEFTKKGLSLKAMYEPTLSIKHFKKIPREERNYRYQLMPPFAFFHFVK